MGAIDTAGITNGDNNDHWVYPHPTDFKLSEHYIDDVKPLKAAVIGSGLSGITAGVLLPAKVPGLELTILEKNSNVVSPASGLSI